MAWIRVIIGGLFFSVLSVAAEDKPTRWSGETEDGWKIAIELGAKGDGRGSIFWLFDKQPFQWSEKEGVVTMRFRDAWHLFSEDGKQLKVKITQTGMLFMRDGLFDAEWECLKGVILKPGGSPPHLLAGRARGSVYEKYHERGALVLKVDTVPVGLAAVGLGIFQSGGNEVRVLCRHKEIPRSVLQGLLKTAARTKVKGHRKAAQPWNSAESILLALADHPNLEKEELRKLWNQPFIYWTPVIWRKVRDHPNADPAWKDEFKKRVVAKTKEAERIRAILAKDNNLDLETWDILLEYSKSDRSYRTTKLADHPKLDAERMRRLYAISPSSSANGLVRRKDIPHDLLEKIIGKGEPELLGLVMENATAPEKLRISAALMLSKNKSFNRASDALSNEMLPISRIRELAKHPEPAVRFALARNPNLPEDLLKKFADDDYRCVAETARKMCIKRLGKEAQVFLTGLRDKKTLKPSYGFEDEMRIALDKDDPKVFFDRMDLLWEPVTDIERDMRVSSWLNTALAKNAYRCLDEWVKKDHRIRAAIVKMESKNWSKEVVDILLKGQPSEELQSQFILNATKFHRLDLIEEYAKRKLSMEAANKQPLIWYATMSRNEKMIKQLLKMGADPKIAKNGVTPSALAVRMNFVPAIKLLPISNLEKKALEAFKAKYPGDPKAAWVGGWTNGKSEFKTIGLTFAGDGNGVIYSATGLGMPFVWKKESATKVTLFVIADGKVNEKKRLIAEISAEGLNLHLSDQQIEKMVRSKKQ